MKDVQDIAREIVQREGGFVDDPDDPGGATKFGVTIHTLRRLGMDIDGDGDVDVNDVRRLSVAQAQEIFLKHYYERPRIGMLPDCLRASVFDMYVNAGAQAVKSCNAFWAKWGFRFRWTASLVRKPLVRRKKWPSLHRIIWQTHTGYRGGITISAWLTSAPKAGNMRGGRMAAKGAGSRGPRHSFLAAITSATRNFNKGCHYGCD